MKTYVPKRGVKWITFIFLGGGIYVMYHYFLLILTIVTFYLINNWIVYLNALLVSHPSLVYSNGNVAQAAKHAMIVCPLNGVDSSRQFCS